MAAKTAHYNKRISPHTGENEIVLRVTYDPAFIATLKAAVAPADRRWSREDRVWLIHHVHEKPLMAALARLGFQVVYDSKMLTDEDDSLEPCFSVEVLRPVALSANGQPIARGDLSPDQVQVFDATLSWFRDPNRRQFLTIGGLAGTGKSTIIAALAGALRDRGCSISFAAYTGKAAGVMRDKLAHAGIAVPFGAAYCGTIHGLIYRPETDPKTGRIIGWLPAPDVPGDLIIVDEASMIGADAWSGLLSYGLPVLAVGDHGQLAPVGGDSVSVVAEPDLRLEQVHRQAAGSPILALAHHVRQGGNINNFPIDGDIIRRVRAFPQIASEFATAFAASESVGRLGGAASMSEVALLCYYNKTRIEMNSTVRKMRGIEGPAPDPGEIVVCLKNMGPSVYNGMRGVVAEADYGLDRFGRIPMSVFCPDDNINIKGLFQSGQFGREKTIAEFDEVEAQNHPYTWNHVGLLFDFGYTLTVHKSQGSSFREVGVVLEGRRGDDEARRRWQYTAVTRAKERLWLIG